MDFNFHKMTLSVSNEFLIYYNIYIYRFFFNLGKSYRCIFITLSRWYELLNIIFLFNLILLKYSNGVYRTIFLSVYIFYFTSRIPFVLRFIVLLLALYNFLLGYNQNLKLEIRMNEIEINCL